MTYEVYIGDGYIGDIHGDTIQEARENAIKLYNIQHDQLITLKRSDPG